MRTSSMKKKSKTNIFEDKVDNNKNQIKYFFESDLSGYSLAKFLLKTIRAKNKNIFTICMYIIIFLSALRSLLPIIYELSINNPKYSSLEILILILSTILNFFYFTMNYIFLIFGIFELDKSYRILSQLSNLLSPKPIEEYHTTKTLPTINFFCPVSLKCWDSLHRLFRNYGAKFRLRINYYLSIFLIYITILLVLIVVSIFEGIEFNNGLIIIIFSFEVVIITVTLLIIFLKALVINDHYHKHIFLIKKNKNVLSDLLNLYAVYFEKEDYIPYNEIYKEGVFRIKYNVSALINLEQQMKPGKNMNLQKEESIKKSLMNLIGISENIIEDLQFSAKYMPFKVLGISVNKQFFQSVIAALGSVLFVIFQQILN